MVSNSSLQEAICAAKESLKKISSLINKEKYSVCLFRSGSKAFEKVTKIVNNIVHFKKYRKDIYLYAEVIVQNLNLVLLDLSDRIYLELEEKQFKNTIINIIDRLMELLKLNSGVQLTLFDVEDYHQEKPQKLNHKSFKNWFDRKFANSGYNYKLAFPNPYKNIGLIQFFQLSITDFILR